MNDCTVKRKGGLGCAKQLLVISHKFVTYFLQKAVKSVITAHNGWNVPPMILTHESMEELRAFVIVLKKVAFDFLTEELFFRKL
jgi:hypothetical protein